MAIISLVLSITISISIIPSNFADNLENYDISVFENLQNSDFATPLIKEVVSKGANLQQKKGCKIASKWRQFYNIKLHGQRKEGVIFMLKMC